jgi:hypothetical protein
MCSNIVIYYDNISMAATAMPASLQLRPFKRKRERERLKMPSILIKAVDIGW